MSRSFAWFRVVAVAAAVGLVAAGCTRKDTVEKDVLGFIDGTQKLSNRYVYEENAAGQQVTVRGLVEDDFRYKARMSLNDADILDEVVSDDAMAVRFLDPSVLPRFVRSEGSSSVASPQEALAQQQWVLDVGGAPPAGITANDERYAGIDPVVDSLSVLAYARQAITEGRTVRKYNPESIDYRPQEDPFPTPKPNSGIDRYDVEPPVFPKPDAVTTSGDQQAAFVDAAYFRKLSVYVKDKRVIQVRERIAAEGKVLEKFKTYMKAFSKQAGEEAETRVDQIIDRLPEDQQAGALLQLLNFGLQRAGRPTVRFRTLSYELRDLGAKVSVAMPTDVVQGKLDFFGVNAVREDTATTPSAGGGTSGDATVATTTTVATATSTP